MGLAQAEFTVHQWSCSHASCFCPLQLTDFLVGDGPGSRYALICAQCHSHNGMALKDEFEYTGIQV